MTQHGWSRPAALRGLLRDPSGRKRLRLVPSGQCGFTLIEITIVVFILALVAMLVTPKLQRFAGGDARSASRELAGMLSSLVQDAVAAHSIYRLYYDLDTDEFWVTTLKPVGGVLEEGPPIGAKRRLPADVQFEEVATTHQGLVTSGTAFTQFFPSGAVTRTTIHLRDEDEDKYSLSVNPITGRVVVKDGYVETVGTS